MSIKRKLYETLSKRFDELLEYAFSEMHEDEKRSSQTVLVKEPSIRTEVDFDKVKCGDVLMLDDPLSGSPPLYVVFSLFITKSKSLFMDNRENVYDTGIGTGKWQYPR